MKKRVALCLSIISSSVYAGGVDPHRIGTIVMLLQSCPNYYATAKLSADNDWIWQRLTDEYVQSEYVRGHDTARQLLRVAGQVCAIALEADIAAGYVGIAAH
jgi:hypothetical protein